MVAPRWSFILRLFGLGLLLFVAVSGSLLYVGYIRPVAQAVGDVTGQTVAQTSADASNHISKVAGASLVAGSVESSRRLNILLLGSDTDPKFQGVYDTQIMILVSFDLVRKQVTMLSIPRDLWLEIPGFGMGKIGTAYHDGGLQLARETVERDLHVRVDNYAWVGLDGFIKTVDTLGGVDLDVSHPIVDDRYPDDVGTADPYAYRRLYIPAGPQHLDGARALEYVRSRHGDLIGDFGRSTRQQQILQSLRAKFSAQEILARLPELANDLHDSVRTDLSLLQLAQLARSADQFGGREVHSIVLAPPTYSSDGTSADGQSIVVPNWPAIDQALAELR